MDRKTGGQLRISPNLILIGAQKSGTTALYNYLKDLDDVHMSYPLKEPRYFMDFAFTQKFFRKKKKLHIKSRDQLLSRYMLKGYGGQSWFGEASTGYTISDNSKTHQIPEKIFTSNPDTRLIYILRNPFERMVSNFLHARRHKLTEANLDNLVMKGGALIQNSLYFKQLSAYLEIFPREQILVVFFEQMKNEPEQFLRKIHSPSPVDAR